MEKFAVTMIALILIGGTIFVALFTKDEPKITGLNGNPNVISAATTSSAVAVTTSTRILATTTNALGTGSSYTRKYAQICNPSATIKVLVSLNKDIAADGRTNGGYWIDSNECFEIDDRNQYSGSVTASTSDQSSVKVLVTEYVE